MYLEHYHLQVKPFQISSDPEFLWLGENHKEALAILKYGILDNKGFLLLTGDVGTGKTTLINALVSSLGDDIVWATVPDPGLELIDFFNYISNAFGIDEKFVNKGDFILAFRQFLFKAHQDAKRVLLIIDESQRLNNALLEEIRLLSNIEMQNTKLLNIFFVGQNEFNDLLWEPRNRALRQRITVNYNVYALTADEISGYVRHRLKVAGTEDKIFGSDAIHEIMAYSGGFPRMINIICDHAMLTGYVRGLKKINAEIIKECASDLQIPRYQPHLQNELTVSSAPMEAEAGETSAPYAGIRADAKNANNMSGRILRLLAYALVLILLLAAGYFLGNPNSTIRMRLKGYWNAWQGDVRNGMTMPIPKRASRQTPTIAQSPKRVQGTDDAAPDEAPVPIPSSTDSQRPTNEGGANEEHPQEDDAPRIVKEKAPRNPAGDASKILELQKESPPKRNLQKSMPEAERSNISQADTQSLLTHKLIIYFPHNSNEFSSEARAYLDRVSDILMHSPDLKIKAVGYTDSLGDNAYNKSLSIFRANIVKSYLVGKGVSPAQIETLGLGSQNPLGANTTIQGRQYNRRVEIEFQ